MLLLVTTFHIHVGNQNIKSDGIRLHHGLFQGNLFSPLPFFLAISPLSIALKASKCVTGFKTGEGKIDSHLLYMDDLKIFSPRKNSMEKNMDVAMRMSIAIGMELGFKKCCIAHKSLITNSIENTYKQILILQSDICKYLGLDQLLTVNRENSKPNTYES